MRSTSTVLALLIMIAATSIDARAQDSSDADDTTRSYKLGDVTVHADSFRTVAPTTVQRIPTARIARTDAQTAAGIVYQIPSARIQTNSRGEALVYMRAAAERQVALFFDGALMNTPWDNRLDMSMVPAGAIGSVTVSKGAPSVLYGANTLGGTINMVSLDQPVPGSTTEIQSQVGTNGLVGGGVVHMGRAGSLSYIGEIGYTSRDGERLSRSASLSFNQDATDVRTNSDLRSFNAYARAENRFNEDTEVGLAVHFTDASKGVAPEGHIEGARFWRYPTWRGLTVSVNSEALFGSDREWAFRGAGWGTSFSQDIAQYDDARYDIRTAQEEDRDLTLGTRLLLRRSLGNGGITLAFNGLSSTHDQRDLEFDSTGALIELVDGSGVVQPYPVSEYEQQTYSIGLETEQRFADVGVTLGASFDGMMTPKTGDKPSQQSFSDYSVVAGLTYDVSENLSLRASGGRKSRFPTMRELYGEALRRFLINPNLKPEQTWVAELGTETRGAWGSLGAVGFVYNTANTIDQRTIDTLGGNKRQRINLDGSNAIGVEVSGALRAFAPLRVDGHFTFVSAHGRASTTSGADSTFSLTEKPNIIATVTAEYAFRFGLLPSIELVHTGLAYSPNDDDELVELAPSSVLNLRLAYRFSPWSDALAQIYARVNNVTDALVQPQLGLPAPGREILGGIKLEL